MKGWGFLCYMVAVVFLWQWIDHDQDLRSQKQGTLLASIEALHTPDASRFVEKWSATFRKPSADDLSALTVVAERLVAEPGKAALAAQQIIPHPTLSDLWNRAGIPADALGLAILVAFLVFTRLFFG